MLGARAGEAGPDDDVLDPRPPAALRGELREHVTATRGDRIVVVVVAADGRSRPVAGDGDQVVSHEASSPAVSRATRVVERSAMSLWISVRGGLRAGRPGGR